MKFRISRAQSAFTMIELLVVIAIIGILAAIAIPQFKQYRTKAFDASARADLRNTAVAEEAYFVQSSSYISCVNAACVTALPGIKGLTSGVTLTLAGTATGFVGTALNTKGSGISYYWNSSNGGMQ